MSSAVSEQDTETPAAEPGQPLEQRVNTIEDKLDKVLGMLTGGGDKPAESDEPEEDAKSVAAREARAEVQRLAKLEQAKKSRDDEKAAAEARIAAVEEKVKEKPPREYRKITKWHGWVGEDDK